MQAVLIIVHLLVAVALICVVLLQRSEGGALGMGGGGSGLGGLFSPRGAANTLSRTTAILGLMFFVTSMSLTLLSLGARRPTSILNQAVPGQTAPAAPGAPPTLPSRAPGAPPTLPSANPGAPAVPPAAPALPAVPPSR
jgi:preprotein translocase subunit SecG